MFLLNQKFVKYRLGFVTFTIQNVPIKYVFQDPKYSQHKDLQYKMFLLNLSCGVLKIISLSHLQYKMFLLNQID